MKNKKGLFFLMTLMFGLVFFGVGDVRADYPAVLVGGVNYNVPVYNDGSGILSTSNQNCVQVAFNPCAFKQPAPLIGYIAASSFSSSVPLYSAPGSSSLFTANQYCVGVAFNPCAMKQPATLFAHIASSFFSSSITIYSQDASVGTLSNTKATINNQNCVGVAFNPCAFKQPAPIIGYIAPTAGTYGGTFGCPSGGVLTGLTCKTTGSLAITPSSCVIAGGARGCNANVTWNTSGASAVNVTLQDRATETSPNVRTTLSTAPNMSSPGITIEFHPYTGVWLGTGGGGSDLAGPLMMSWTCAAGTNWWNDKCLIPPTGSLTLLQSSCTIPAGASTCNVNATWTTTNAYAPDLVAMDNYSGSYGPKLSTQSSQSSPGLQIPVAYGFTNFDLRETNTRKVSGGNTTPGDVVLSSKQATATCAAGSSWNGLKCAAGCPAGSFGWNLFPNSCSGPYSAIADGGNMTISNTQAGKVGSATLYCNNGALVPSNMTCTVDCTSLNTSGSGLSCATYAPAGTYSGLPAANTVGTFSWTYNGCTGVYTYTGGCSAPVAAASCSGGGTSWLVGGVTCGGPYALISSGSSRTISSTNGNPGAVTLSCNNGTVTQSGQSCTAACGTSSGSGYSCATYASTGLFVGLPTTYTVGTISYNYNSCTGIYTYTGGCSAPAAAASCSAGGTSWLVGGVTCGGPYALISSGSSRTISSTNGNPGNVTLSCNNGSITQSGQTCTNNCAASNTSGSGLSCAIFAPAGTYSGLPAANTIGTFSWTYDGCTGVYTYTGGCTAPVITVALNVSTFTNTQVTSSPGSINCDSGTGTCSASYPVGTLVTLTGSGSAGYLFNNSSNWISGCDSFGSGNTCIVTMSSAKTVTAKATCSDTVTCDATALSSICTTASCTDTCFISHPGTKNCSVTGGNWHETGL